MCRPVSSAAGQRANRSTCRSSPIGSAPWGERVTVSFNDGEVVLTIVEPGRWWTADGEVTVADAKSVHLHIHLSWGPRPDDGDLDCRILDFRTEPGAVTDREGHRVRWYPPGRARRLRHLGARRVPAVRLVRLPESLRGPTAIERGEDGSTGGGTGGPGLPS